MSQAFTLTCRQTYTHLHSYCKVNKITPESTAIFVIWPQRVTKRDKGVKQTDRQQKHLRLGSFLS